MDSDMVKVIIQDVEHKSSRDNKGTLPPDVDWLGGDITKVTSDLLSSPPYSSVDNPQQTNLISGQLQLTIHSLKASIRFMGSSNLDTGKLFPAIFKIIPSKLSLCC
jgi:hypothetical protein